GSAVMKWIDPITAASSAAVTVSPKYQKIQASLPFWVIQTDSGWVLPGATVQLSPPPPLSPQNTPTLPDGHVYLARGGPVRCVAERPSTVPATDVNVKSGRLLT